MYKKTYWQRDTQTGRRTDRYNTCRCRETHRQAWRDTQTAERHTDRQRDKQAERHTDSGETNRQAERHTNKYCMKTYKHIERRRIMAKMPRK
jgi:hypothetical protein